MMAFVISLCIVALGQPARVYWLCPIAAAVGYALLFGSFSKESSRKRRFWLSALWFASVQAIQLSWMTSIDYQGYYILFVYLFLCCILGLQFGLFCALLPQRRMQIGDVFVFSAFWTLLEWSRVHIACGFSWNPVGLALGFDITALQFAALFGIFGLSFWVLFVNLWFFKALRDAQSALPWCKTGLAAIILALVPYLFGGLHLQYHRARMSSSEKTLKVVLVQTGLLPSEKTLIKGKEEDYITPDEQWERILTYLKQEKACDLIALPEAVVPMHSDALYCTLENARSLFANAYGAAVERYFPKISYPFAEHARVSNLFWAHKI
jgi:apolipoprotein N-acyltransferase